MTCDAKNMFWLIYNSGRNRIHSNSSLAEKRKILITFWIRPSQRCNILLWSNNREWNYYCDVCADSWRWMEVLMEVPHKSFQLKRQTELHECFSLLSCIFFIINWPTLFPLLIFFYISSPWVSFPFLSRC